MAKKAVKGLRLAKHLEPLAAAYAENGMFEEAVATQKEAIALLGERKNVRTESMRARLALYGSRRPFRDGLPRPI
jgi:hypothetical protein